MDLSEEFDMKHEPLGWVILIGFTALLVIFTLIVVTGDTPTTSLDDSIHYMVRNDLPNTCYLFPATQEADHVNYAITCLTTPTPTE